MNRLIQVGIIFLFVLNNFSSRASDFITIWDLSLDTFSNTKINFLCTTSGSVTYLWETIPSGSSGSGIIYNGSATISGLPQNAIIQLKISPINFKSFEMHSRKLIDVAQWGTAAWTTMTRAFQGCKNLHISAHDLPDLTNVKDMSSMFSVGNVIGNTNMNLWNTSAVEDMSSMFSNAIGFNQLISAWDVSKVKTFFQMFYGASSFNQPIGNWNTSNVSSMSHMFYGATSFNQPLNNWNVSNVESMFGMFENASSFNQPLDNWDVSKVLFFANVFSNTLAFNQPLNSWNVGKSTDFSRMFYKASAFNQTLNSWNLVNATRLSEMFKEAISFNQQLDNWNTSKVTHIDGIFDSAISFNQNINDWNLSKVLTSRNAFRNAYQFNQKLDKWKVLSLVDASSMFENAKAFNQNLGEWSINASAQVLNMLDNCGMDCNNYTASIFGWFNNPNVNSNVSIGVKGLNFGTNVAADRNYLINNLFWNFIGDSTSGANCCLKNATFYQNPLSTSGIQLTALLAGANYQWCKCNPFQLIPNANSQSFVASAPGEYAVIVTAVGCQSDTSACISVQPLSIGINDKSESLLYPNPSLGTVYFSKNIEIENCTLHIYSTTGQPLLNYNIEIQNNRKFDISGLQTGLYLVEIKNKEYSKWMKINKL